MWKVCYYFWYVTTKTGHSPLVWKWETYSRYFDYNKKELYLLFETVKYWVHMEFSQGIALVYVFVCIIWLYQQGRRFFLWIIWIFCIFASTNDENCFCFPPDMSNSINISSLSILSPILQESLSINLTFFRRFLQVLNSNYFQLWLYSTNVPQANESKVHVLWDRDCSESFRSASKSLIHTNTGFQPCPELLPPLPWARSLSQSHCIWGQGGSSSHQQQQQQWWTLPHLLQGRSASLV